MEADRRGLTSLVADTQNDDDHYGIAIVQAGVHPFRT